MDVVARVANVPPPALMNGNQWLTGSKTDCIGKYDSSSNVTFASMCKKKRKKYTRCIFKNWEEKMW